MISFPIHVLGKISLWLGRVGARYEHCEWLNMWEGAGVDVSEFLPIDANRYILTGKDVDGSTLIPSGRAKQAEHPSAN